MALTFDDIKNIVFSFQKARDDTVLESTIEASIHAAINAILREGSLPAIQYDPRTITMTIGEDEYKIDDNVFKILSVELIDTTGSKGALHFVAPDDWKLMKHGTQTNAKPVNWSVWKDKLVVHPSPDKAYTVDYPSSKKVGGIEAIDEEFRDVVITGAQSFFDKSYVSLFEKGKREVQRYWDLSEDERLSFQFDADQEQHYATTKKFNVV